MADWLSAMQRTYEYYIVDPGTWRDVSRITNVKSCTINRDAETETLGSATIDVTDSLGECYVRIYLVTIQNGIKERHPLGTFLVQTPSSSFDGLVRNVTMDAYTPLLELKESPPPLGYSLSKDLSDRNIMDIAYRLTKENVRAPVVAPECDKMLETDFVANTDDTWISFISDLIYGAKYTFDLDEMGRILFAPKQDLDALQPVWTFTDDNSSILYSDISMEHDLFGIPNVIEVVYSEGGKYYESIATNDDPNSPTSTVNRGRRIVERITNPSLPGIPSKSEIDEYAERVLKERSSIQYSVSFSHGYCPVRLGDCVRLNYTRSGITNVKAKIISQSIDCTPECKVSTKAVFTTKLWR